MSSIQTGIELNDQFSGVLNNIISSVNLAVSAMYDMQQSMNADIDTSSLEGARDEINQATAAIEAMNQAASRQTAPDIAPPVVDGGNQEPISVPVDPVLPDPLVENPEPIRPEIQPNAPPDPEPVEIPVTWNTDGVDVFTGTGVERFQQEVQSANDMLNTLNTTQARISQTAQGMDILPDAAVQDMNTMQQRLSAIQQRIQQIENNPVNVGADNANAELEQLRMQLNQAIQEQNSLNQAMQNMDVSAANDAYLRLSQTVGNTERYIRDNVDEQGRFNQEISAGTQQANELTNTIKRAVAAYISIQSVGKALNISDELVQTTSRLNMMNDGVQTTAELVNMVYAAAQDARGSFGQMADVVARFGNNAKDAFSSSEEVVAFADLIQKQMTIAGASTQEAANAELQLSQALGSGVLRGDELNSIFEQAPNLIQNIADYLDVPIGKIREMAADGELSADVVKAAIFSAADDINSKFNEMPMTWGQMWQSMQNTALIAFQPVLQRLNDLANSEAFQTFIQGAIEAMATLVSYLPPFMQSYKEPVAALEAENPEFSLMWSATDRCLRNRFISTADEYGISRFEKMLKIYPTADDTLESRRSRVQSKWFNTIPYTWKVLLQKLLVLCGDSDFEVTGDFKTGYTLYIDTDLELYGQVEELENIINTMIPENLVVVSKNSIPCNIKGAVLFGGGICFINEFIITNDFREVFNVNGSSVFGGGIVQTEMLNITNDSQETVSVQGTVQLYTTVGNADSVSLAVSPGAYATVGDIQALEKEIADLKAYVGYSDGDIYGVEVDFENKKFTRLAGAVNRSAGSGFDGINAFGGRKRCNIWWWIDGINHYANATTGECETYVADHGFADDIKAAPYEDTGMTAKYGNGYISAFCYSEDFDWLFLPGEFNGNTALPVGDYCWNQNGTGWRVARLGASWGHGLGAGAFFWYLSDASSSRGRGIGGRLVYRKKVAA